MTDETPEAAAAVPAQSAQSIAGEVASVDETIMKFLPYIGTILGVIPGAQVGVPIVGGLQLVLKAIDDGAKLVAGSNPGASPTDIFTTLVNHLTPGQPNSPVLS